jgi:hypothetical protein
MSAPADVVDASSVPSTTQREIDMKSKRHVRLAAILVGLLSVFAVTSSAAQAEELNPGYEQFAGCPNPFLPGNTDLTCVRSVITGGNFKMGNKNVPISNPMKLSGGVEGGFKNFTYNSEGGLEKVRQPVPGGLVGLTGLEELLEILSVEQLKLYAVTELAGAPEFKNLNTATLRLKIHLENAVLGNNCYVGSNANPIVLHLTTGTTEPPPPNEPITGKPATPGFEPEREIVFAKEGEFVDNSFAAPGASGCVLNLGLIPLPIDALVNAASGLPSAAGHNETRQQFELELVNATFPYQ